MSNTEEGCALGTQNLLKRALSKVNGLNTSKNQLINFTLKNKKMETFCGFRVFECDKKRKPRNDRNHPAGTKTW